MKLRHTSEDQVTVVTLEGDLTHEDAQALRDLCQKCLLDQTRDFVIDLTQVEFIDSEGLETLLGVLDQTSEVLGQMRLVGVCENVATILSMTRLNTVFESRPTVESAMESLKV